MPAAALTLNSACGRDTQLKIWIGSTVNGDQIESGAKVANVTAPMVISGAVTVSYTHLTLPTIYSV